MRAVVVMVAAGCFATATAWAAAPTAAHAAKAQHSAHRFAHEKGLAAKTALHQPHKKGAKRSVALAKSAKASKGHSNVQAHTPHTTRQTSAHKPAKPAALRPAQRHKLMVDTPTVPSMPTVAVKRTTPQSHELPPILS